MANDQESIHLIYLNINNLPINVVTNDGTKYFIINGYFDFNF